ncbi:MAG: FtsH protease activity modulator HflK [Gammaproteobacteria bacterium]
MAWNQPGGDNKDPWGNNGGNKNDQGPPDLDEVVRKAQKKLSGLFGGKGGGSGSGSSGGTGSGSAFAGLGVILLVGFVVWAASGFYIVDAGRQGIVLRLGKFHTATTPGPHWRIPMIDQVEVVNVDERRTEEIGYRESDSGQGGAIVTREALMLTEDENIVNIQLAIQYQVSDARHFLFSVREPQAVIRQVAESAVREVVGKSKMDFVLKEGRTELVTKTKSLMQAILDAYNSGLMVSDVNLVDAQPPEEVQSAFSDAIKAREDKERYKNEAEAYANEIIPRARGAAARQTQEAEGYRSAVIAKAEGEANRFSALLVEYKKAPEVTRKRLYIDTIESVLSSSNKVIMDSDSSNNLMYLPIDKLLENKAEPAYTSQGSGPSGRTSKSLQSSAGRSATGTVKNSRNSREPR